MRKVISLMHMSLDGFVADANGEMDWIGYDNEIFQYAIDLAGEADAAIYGRVTYQMMEGYWPTVLTNPESTPQELHHANWVENVHKIVFSKSLESVEWNNTTLINENIAEEMGKLKQQTGKDMMIFGSASITHTLAELGLIDEYRLTISPVVLGSGTPMFKDVKGMLKLKLLGSKTFDNVGVVALHYQVVK